jgi:anti-sigma factor RsiW
MTCAETHRTQAFIDGELDGPAAAAAERHIEGCADCQTVCAEAADLSDAIRAHAVRHRAPELVRARIVRRLDREAGLPRRSFWLGAASGGGLTGLAAALAAFALLPPSFGALTDAITAAHTGALMGGREIAVVSSDHHTVKPWFAGRIDISPPVSDFAAHGFALAGGRLDEVAGEKAAVLVYRHGRHEIDLFVWADRGQLLPQTGLRHGYRSLFWKARDLDFAAVSDVQDAELARFVGLVRSQPE